MPSIKYIRQWFATVARHSLLAGMVVVGLWTAVEVHAAPAKSDTIKVLPDSSNFVKASLVVIGPLNSVISSVGHVGLHMQCPSYGLDFIWSQNTMYSPILWLQELYGYSPVAGVWQPTDSMMAEYRAQGRSVTEYPLHLTHHEKQRLWQLLDEASEEGVFSKFRLDTQHCASTIIFKLKDCLIDEWLDTGDEQLTVGEYGRIAGRKYPWIKFTHILISGARHDKKLSRDYLIAPEFFADYLSRAVIRSNDGRTTRHIIDAKGKQLLTQRAEITTLPITPWMLFTAIAVLALLITVARRAFGWQRAARIFDRVLFTAYMLWTIAFVHFMIIGYNMLGAVWNWYLIPFNLLPLFVWIICRRKGAEVWHRLWGIYTAVLAAFLLMTPVSGQIDFPLQFITVALLLRCADRWTGELRVKS